MLTDRAYKRPRDGEAFDTTVFEERYHGAAPSEVPESICCSPTKKHRTSLGHDDTLMHNDFMMDSASDSTQSSLSTTSFSDMVEVLDAETLRTIVNVLATQSSVAQSLVSVAYSQTLQGIDFRNYAQRVDSIISGKSEQYSSPGSACAGVRACIAAIAVRVGPQSPFNTKRSALEALHDIALTVIRTDRSRQSIEVKREFEKDDCIVQLMLQIIQTMPMEERLGVGRGFTSYGSTLLDSIRYVHEKSVENYVAGFYDLALVLHALESGPSIAVV
ncbi:hypothetical protein JX265_007420 [Neoarthrinium moseri]|uniref:Uncharacterized protein n=1 Tax=Neoarthrinium moseri TaxID=1658444 RepID=A0A9Q0APY6_9PEZI|nr:hypothetical protein JX265_007420 [Neoarthrinium moseri]